MRFARHVREYFVGATVEKTYIRRLLNWLKRAFGKHRQTRLVLTVRNMRTIRRTIVYTALVYWHAHLVALAFLVCL